MGYICYEDFRVTATQSTTGEDPIFLASDACVLGSRSIGS